VLHWFNLLEVLAFAASVGKGPLQAGLGTPRL